jgi:(p)ppGpp synthase/HD superfamily hydrolase
MVSDYKLNTGVIVTSVLHNIVEDTEVTTEMILDTFG